jgi:hypothetical protein
VGAGGAVAAAEAAALPLSGPQAVTGQGGAAGDPVRPAHRDRLGAPAAGARLRLGFDLLSGHGREVATLVLLPIGGIVVPVLGWFVGVALLWTSERWSVRDKLLGTLVVPGGRVGWQR